MEEESFSSWYSHGGQSVLKGLAIITSHKYLLLNDIPCGISFQAAHRRLILALSRTRGYIYRLSQERR
jgi:hypothetical protein